MTDCSEGKVGIAGIGQLPVEDGGNRAVPLLLIEDLLNAVCGTGAADPARGRYGRRRLAGGGV